MCKCTKNLLYNSCVGRRIIFERKLNFCNVRERFKRRKILPQEKLIFANWNWMIFPENFNPQKVKL